VNLKRGVDNILGNGFNVCCHSELLSGFLGVLRGLGG